MVEELTQKEAEDLIGMKKKFFNRDKLVLNEPFDMMIELISENKEATFILDLRQGSINLTKIRYQKRYEVTIPLVRYDSRGVHQNPPEAGGEIIKGPHLHIYREGFSDKVATSAEGFDNPNDVMASLSKFCELFNIEKIKFEQQKSPRSFE